ncbi:unnamed protein product [Acanthoscelides obtectus]|uniref:Uncharacterized protein n=1 Tax=Acanthoscelides obtectus TaxID=200917 RepID=A0A9P0MJP5_ACAOB|nr:unnamed protein product [Acanthoscelides obtectus]CAK1629813.1 hypothetical protein AOBTE_LOCUS5972 [Acanthoscelides obtectus]
MPIVKPPASTMQNFTDAILLESPRQKKTVAQVYPVENDIKISPEVHKTDPRGADGAIPYDIKETIVALKNAQLPTSHKQDNDIIDVSKQSWESTILYRYPEFSRNISLIVNLRDRHDRSLKVIATAVELVNSGSECGDHTLGFTLSNKTVCLTVESKLLWALLLTMVMAFILQHFSIHWLNKMIPEVPKDSFVYDIDDSMMVSRFGNLTLKLQSSTEDGPQSSARTSSNL